MPTNRRSSRAGRISRWVAAVVCVLLGGAAGLWVHSQLPRTWTSTTSVLVLPTGAGLESGLDAGARSGSVVQIDTEVELARSAQVAQRAAEALGGRLSATELLAATDVTVPTNSTVLGIDVTTDDPVLARDAAAAVADAYLARRQEEAQAAVESAVESLSTRVDDLTGRLQVVAAQIGTLGPEDTSGRALAESQRTLLVSQLADVNSRLIALQSGASQSGEVITAAEVPAQPTSPNLLVNVAAGLVLGSLVGGLVLIVLGKRGSLRAAALRRDAVLRDLGRLDLDAAESAMVADTPLSPELSRILARVDVFEGAEVGPDVVVVMAPPSVVRRVASALNAAWAKDRGGNVMVVPQRGVLTAAEVGDDAEGLAEVVRSELDPELAVRRDGALGTGVMGPGRGSAQLPPAALRTNLQQLWGVLGHRRQGVMALLVPPLDSVEAQSVLRTAGRVVVFLHPSGGEDAIADLYADIDFLGLSGRLVGTVELTASDRPEPDRPVVRREPARDRSILSRTGGS